VLLKVAIIVAGLVVTDAIFVLKRHHKGRTLKDSEMQGMGVSKA